MPISWPLTGRDPILERARDSVTHGAGVLLVGAAGVGKTRLARELAANISRSRTFVDWAGATPSSPMVPFGVLAHLLDGTVLQSDFRNRVDMLRRVCAALKARAGEHAYVLVVDDVQWLDDLTMSLVQLLVNSGSASVILTFRLGEPMTPDLHGLWKDELIDRIDLEPLKRDEVEQLLASVVPGPMTVNAHRQCWKLSQGNPLFVRELTLAGLESGALSERDGVFDWVGPATSSTRLTEILEQRLASASPAATDLLETLAIGEPVPAEIVVAVCGSDALADAERSSLVSVADDDASSVRLCHPLYASHLRDTMTSAARQHRLRVLADAFEASPEFAERDLVRVAAWRLDAGGSMSADLLARAAETANAVFDHALASRLASRAVADGGGFRASLALGWALMGERRHDEAHQVLEQLAGGQPSPAECVELALARYRCATYQQGFRLEFDEILRQAEEVADSPGDRSFLRSQRATLLGFAGQVNPALAIYDEIRGSGDEAAELRAVPGVGIGLVSLGRPDSADRMAMALVEPSIRLQPMLPDAPFWVFSIRLSALTAAGRFVEIDELIAQLKPLIPPSRDDASSVFALHQGLSGVDRGKITSAVRWLREAIDDCESSFRWRVALAASLLVEASALLGDPEGAGAALVEAEEMVASARVFEGYTRRARGWNALAQGRRVDALALLAEAADWSLEHDQIYAEMRSLHDAMRLGAGGRVVRRLVDVAGTVEGPLAAGILKHATATLSGDGDRLAEASAQFEHLGANLLAAESASQAANAFADDGLSARARRSRSHAGALAALCEGAHSPALENVSRPVSLTRRESEIARLAAAGLSARRIGEKLCVSTRTVEGHLHRTYQKLGVSDREGLARILGGV